MAVRLLIALLAVEAAGIVWWWHDKQTTLQDNHERQLNRVRYEHENQKKKLADEFEGNRYRASGETVFDRVHNTQNQDIAELIQRLAQEAFPPEWKSEVKVEEFTSLILLLQSKAERDQITSSKVAEWLAPVITYSSPYLANVAVYDRYHRCCLFFDESALEEIKESRQANERLIANARASGRAFRRFDSVRIEFTTRSGHIFLPVTVTGESGVDEMSMMLDTGASMTVIPEELAGKTGHEDLRTARRETFTTANGLMDCPIVTRDVAIGGVDNRQNVAVNTRDNLGLLGVDFFKGKNYLIDTATSSIYIWSK